MVAEGDGLIAKKARHDCVGRLPGAGNQRDTVVWETLKPSIRSSPWIRGAPQKILMSHPDDQVADFTGNP